MYIISSYNLYSVEKSVKKRESEKKSILLKIHAMVLLCRGERHAKVISSVHKRDCITRRENRTQKKRSKIYYVTNVLLSTQFSGYEMRCVHNLFFRSFRRLHLVYVRYFD